MSREKIKLNPLQNKTLALMQELARHRETSILDEASGEVVITQMPHAHGDHVHVGDYVVSTKDVSGFSNEAVWVALERKGLAKSHFPIAITLTKAGLDYETGLLKAEKSDH
ncbi:MAG: hypothetical protein GC201_18520 [Alphaproteobacteria bacterium]|nr:hypothetical protein [Alphaproteobacteria bacterium]